MSFRSLALVLLLGLALPCLAVPYLVWAEEGEGRAAPVFRRVQTAVHAPQTPHLNTRNLHLTTLVRKSVPEAGRAITMPFLPPGCGMGPFGGLDVEGTLALALDLFALYEFDLQPDLAAAGVRLDGLDPEAKVGILIQPAALGDARAPVRDPSTQELSALEHAGYRVLVMPMSRYRCMQADTSSPMHAAALTIAEFLADATGTRPVDLTVLAKGQPTDIPGSGLEDGVEGASSFELSDAGAFVVLAKEATVALSFVPPPQVQGRERPALLTLPFYWTPPYKPGGQEYDFEATPPAFTLVQDGMAPLVSGRAVFLADASFDPAKPFRILVTLRPGQTHVGRAVRVRTSTGTLR